jgi:drug/metabolite transporter, DME family
MPNVATLPTGRAGTGPYFGQPTCTSIWTPPENMDLSPSSLAVNRSPPMCETSGKLRGRLLVLAAALLWSTSGLFAKAPIFDPWPLEVRGTLLAFWRAMFAAAVLLPLVRQPRWRPALVPLAAIFAGMNLSYLTAMTLTTAANAIWLQSTAPWWVFLIGVLLLGEPILRRDLVPLVFGLGGVGTILWGELHGHAHAGVVWGIASGASYAAVVLLMRRLRAENPAWLVALCHAVTALLLLPWVIHINQWPSAGQLLVLAAFGALQMALPYTLLIRGLRSIGSQEAVAIGLVEPVLMPLWVYLVWHEGQAWWTITGAALILAGLGLRYVVLELWCAKPA